jgi:hypothetical protein
MWQTCEAAWLKNPDDDNKYAANLDIIRGVVGFDSMAKLYVIVSMLEDSAGTVGVGTCITHIENSFSETATAPLKVE